MGKCEMMQELWEKIRTTGVCSGEVCVTDVPVDPLVTKEYERTAKNIAWEARKKNYIFNVRATDSSVTMIYSAELRKLTFDDFVKQIAADIYPKGKCPLELYRKINALKSGIYCADDIVKQLDTSIYDLLVCANELKKERDVMIKIVGSTYLIILGSVKVIDSPLFR